MALPGYPGKKRWGSHPPGKRNKSGKLLRRALYQTVYAWTPFEPDLHLKSNNRIKALTPDKECCILLTNNCDGIYPASAIPITVDECVTYVDGGTIIDKDACLVTPFGGAYVECDYVA
jgi:hypothetical protein|tara:strand:+ start:4006 stop:4359 length:354 start_codon:yes stop_codon:yes gene_type:complete